MYEVVSELKKADQQALFKALEQDLYPKEVNKTEKLLTKIRETRFSAGLGCIHCGNISKKKRYVSFQTTLFM